MKSKLNTTIIARMITLITLIECSRLGRNSGVEKCNSISGFSLVSTLKSAIATAFSASLLIFTFAVAVPAEDAVVDIGIEPGAQYSAHVRVTLPNERFDIGRQIWFLDEYGLIRGLSRRVAPPIRMLDASGRSINESWVPTDRRIDTAGLRTLEYRMLLVAPTGSMFAAAHTSWVDKTGGLLMLDDLLPQSIGKSALIRLNLPPGWQAFASEVPADGKQFRIANIEKTGINIAPSLRETRVNTAIGVIRIGVSGEWLFSDADAAKMATSIADEYGRQFGREIGGEFSLLIGHFPFQVPTGNWEGDTRGRSITIFSSDMPFKNQSLQRLHEQLRHELFHLWAPSALNLTGSYDWFYEGFALYQSLRTGVELNQLRFEDFLDTLGRAHEIDAAAMPRYSLIDASRERWAGSSTQVYARGMLVAFLCDIALLDRSKGKVSSSDLIRNLFAKHRSFTVSGKDGNMAVLDEIRRYPELKDISDRYILAASAVDWSTQLRTGGLISSPSERGVLLTPDPKPSGGAKRILEKLGINNWRRGTKN